MKLNNPVVAYVAENNVDAHIVADMLNGNGVPAYVVEDVSHAANHGTHRPKVWIDQSSAVNATALLTQFDEQKRNRNAANAKTEPILSQCEECGEESEFPASQDGSTQNCPKCDAYMDVGEFEWPDEAE